MGPRIYPSYQDTNTTAKGSLIINYLDIFPDAYNDFIQVTVNGQLRNRDYNRVEGIYRTNLNIGDVVLIELTSDIVLFKNITVYRRDYTTDDQSENLGIVDVFVSYNNSNTITTSLTFTATTISDGYNFEYRITGNVGTDPAEDCKTIGWSADFDSNYIITDIALTQYDLDQVQLGFSQVGYNQFDVNQFGVITNPMLITPIITPGFADATLNYYGNIINYVINGSVPKYLIYPSININTGVTFSSSTISYNSSLNWSKMDCSNDGKYQAIGQTGGSLFVSSDSGTTYSTVTSSVKDWTKVSIPYNSGFPFYGVTSTNGDYIYKINSTTGVTTMSANAKAPTGTSINDFAVSRDSKYVFIVINSGTTIMVSSNSGSTFSNVSTGISMVNPKIAISSTGKYVYLITTTNFIKSSDYGQTWTTAPAVPSPVWTSTVSISCSGTGKYVYLATQPYNRIYASNDYLTTYYNYPATGIWAVRGYPPATFVKPNKN
jgi:photosystem II stability/assembly factor-like uncharacterized protein